MTKPVFASKQPVALTVKTQVRAGRAAEERFKITG